MNRKERRAARKQSSASVTGLFDAALGHHRAGQLAEADRLYRQILSIDPDHVGTLHSLGLLAHQAGRNDIAISLLGRVVALDPGLVPALNNLAKISFLEGHYAQALAVLRRSLAIKETEQTRLLFVECVAGLRTLPPDNDIHDWFVRALSEPWSRPSDLAVLAANLVKADGIGASSDVAAIAGHRVLRALL
ncbi:MAG: tetratricopeptide repeat protein, partial [Sphingomicrobium sp.]